MQRYTAETVHRIVAPLVESCALHRCACHPPALSHLRYPRSA
eukprot:SAG25_NODE_6153_length_583_cov_2.049587_2_plen_41_part_01